jgi:type IV pilus assembly protein PilM
LFEMIRLTNAQLQPIGVDIGFDSIKLLQLETAGETLAVHASLREALPEESRVNPGRRLPIAMEQLRRMLRTGAFSGRRIVTALPREIVHVKNLRLPMIPPEELGAAVEFEARNIFPFDTDAAQVRFLHAGEVRQGSDVKVEVIVLAARNDEIAGFVEQIHACGAAIESLDFEPAAIYRGVERFIRRREDEMDVHVLVDIGQRRSQVVIGRGRDISFFKTIEIGGQQMQEAVSRKLGISVEEARALRRRLATSGSSMGVNAAESEATGSGAARRDPVRQAVYDATRGILEELGREISLCLRYYSVTFRGQRPSKVRLVGGEAADPLLHAALNASLSIPAEPGRPLQSVNLGNMQPSERSGFLCEWAVAFGLGLKLTSGYFGARDGRPRALGAATGMLRDDGTIPVAPEAQVVDLNHAMQTTGSASGASGASGASSAAVATAAAPARGVGRA